MPSTREPRPDLLVRRLAAALQRADQVAAELSAPEVARDPARFRALGREHARLEPIVRSGRRFLQAQGDLAAARELVEAEDGDLAGLALWAGGLFGSTVHWRGLRLRLLPGGRIAVQGTNPPPPAYPLS